MRELPDGDAVCVLVSGGLDSAVLVHRMRTGRRRVHPLYVRCGLSWEPVERRWLDRYLAAVAGPDLAELVVLDLPAGDLYGEHWSTDSGPAPADDTPDEAVYLPGRNLLLVAKAAVWCAGNGVGAIALGPLAGNPFPDATDAFFEAYERALGLGLDRPIRLVRPLARLHKPDVLRLGANLPLELSFSCIEPSGERHCGRCNKCAERAGAFHAAGVVDPTDYARQPALA